MSDQIKSRKKSKIVFELRYPAQPWIFDNRGALIEKIKEKFPALEHWELRNNDIIMSDKLEKPKCQAVVTLKRASFIEEENPDLEKTIENALDYFSILFEGNQLPSELTRTACRLISVHEVFVERRKAKSKEHIRQIIMEKYLANPFPVEIDIPLNDFKLTLTHDNGFYYFGPVIKGERWIKDFFNEPDKHMPDQGIGIDIDSFAKESEVLDFKVLDSLLRNVFALTTQIELQIINSTNG